MLSYSKVNLNDLKLEISENGKQKSLILDGKSFDTTDRFWGSISSRFGLNQKVFKFFTPEEVFNRVKEVSLKEKKGVDLRLVTDDRCVYGTSDPNQKILTFDDVSEILHKRGVPFDFVSGQLQSLVTPDGGHQKFKIGVDDHQHKFFLKIPVDGYGNNTSSVALKRLVCENGMIAMTPAFTTILKVGKGENKNMVHGLSRALNSFNNSDGFSVLEHRVEIAQKSTASLSEVMRIKKVVEKLSTNTREINNAIDKTSGYVLQKYGVTDLRELGKKTKVLPANCTIYELMNIITEVATHKVGLEDANKLHGLIGELLSTEYDLEGTKSKFSDFQDLYFSDKKVI